MDSKNVIDVDDGPSERSQSVTQMSTSPTPLNQHHRRKSSQILDPIENAPRIQKPPSPLDTSKKLGSTTSTGPTWTRPSLSDIQKTTAEIEMTHSKATLAAHELESDGPEGSRHSGKKRRASAAKIKAKHGGGERSSVAKSEAGLPEVTISHGHVPRKGKGSSKMGKSRDHSPNGSVQQLKSSSSAEKPGKDGGADEKENKALRDFLDGIGESDVPASSSSPNMPIDDDVIPGAVPEEFRNYLANGNSNSPVNPASPLSKSGATSPNVANTSKNVVSTSSPEGSDNSIDRDIGVMKSKMGAAGGGSFLRSNDPDLQIRSTPTLDPSQIKQNQRSPSETQRPPPAALRSSLSNHGNLGNSSSRPSYSRRPTDDVDNNTDGRSTPSDMYSESDNQSGPFRAPGTGASQAFTNNMGSGAILSGNGFQKHRRKETPGTSAFRFLQCTVPGSLGLMCMGLPVCYAMSLLSSLAVRSSSVIILFINGSDAKSPDFAPVPMTVISAIVSMASADLWIIATLFGCSVLRKWIKDRWTGFTFLNGHRGSAAPPPGLQVPGSVGPRKANMLTTAVLSQTTIQTVPDMSHQNSATGARRNTVYTASGPSSIQLRRGESADTFGGGGGSGNWFKVNKAVKGVAGSQASADGNWWRMLMMNLLMPPQGSAMSIWSRIILFVGLGVCLEWSMALLCLPSVFYNQPADRGESVFLGIAPLCQFLFLVPVMVGVVGMGHVENEKAKESMIAAFLNITFFQVFRYLLVILLFLLFQITEPITLIIIVSLIVPCIADAIIFAIMGIPFLRLHLLRTRTTALAILRTMTRPTALEATSMAAANAKIQAVDAWGAPVSTLGTAAPPPQFDTGPDYALSVISSWSITVGLLFTIPSRLLILAAPNNAGFIIPAVVAVSVKIIFTVTRFRVFATPTNSSRVAAEDALEEEDMAGDDQKRSSVQNARSTRIPIPTSTNLTGSERFNSLLFSSPIPRKSAIPLLAADHMSSSLASQASIGIAMIALLLLPEVTFPPSLYGSPSIKPATASVYNATGASTFPIFQNPSDKPHVALLPSMFAEPIPEPKTLIYRAIILLILEWVCGAIVAAFVASPFGIVYGPSQQAHTTHAALMVANAGGGGFQGLTTPTVGSSSVTNSTGGTPGPGAGIVGGVDAKALRRSFSRRQSAVRVANLSTVTVDPRLAVISGLEFMRAMGVVGIALSCFWAAVWGLT